MKKRFFIIIGFIFFLTVIVAAFDIRTVYNPFTGKLDYIRGSNYSGENLTFDYWCNSTNCYIISDFYGAEVDPIFSINFTNMQTDCPTGNYSYGIYGNGTYKCRDDVAGAGEADTQKGTSGKYVYNDSINIMFNETEMNDTIDLRDMTIGNCSGDQSCSAIIYDTDEANLNVNSSSWWNGISGWITKWFYKSGNDLALNETQLNMSIDNRTGSNGSVEWIRPEHIADVDDADIESDLNTYVDIAGDTMTGPLVVPFLNVTNTAYINKTCFVSDCSRGSFTNSTHTEIKF